MLQTSKLLQKILMLLTFITTSLFGSMGVYATDLTTDKTIYSVATAHLDTQWNWDLTTSINSYIPNTLTSNFSLFNSYPGYEFNFEGAFRYAMMKEYFPDQYQQLKDYIAQGRWNVAGSSWDAGDVNVPSPEALMRNILYGNGFFKKEFGKTSLDIFLPDCFGFGYALPSIASHMGLIGFSTQKLSWGSAYGIPFNIGRWYGVDGSYLISALNPGSYSASLSGRLSNNSTEVNTVNTNGSKYGVYADYHYYGTGDTGGSPTSASVNYVQQDLDAGVNPTTGVQVLSASSDQLFRDIAAQGLADKLPSWNNELVMTTHGTGSYTSRAPSKRFNRQNEMLADATERASVMADWLGGAPYPKQLFDTAWQRVIWHQFHDDITGTSLPSAYMISWNDYALSLNQFSQELANGVGAIARAMDTSANGIPVVVYNPVSKVRQDVVEAKVNFSTGVPAAVRVYDPDGNETPSQLGTVDGSSATVLFLADMPAVGYKVYDIRPTAASCEIQTGLHVTASTLENANYKVTINSDGDIASIYDKENGKELLAAPSRLQLLNDNSTSWPSWEILYSDVSSAPKAYVSGPAEVTIVENGPVRVGLQIKRTTLGSTYLQTILLTAGSGPQRVDVVNKVDWYTKAANLKVAFPLAVSNPKATYDLGLGTIQRGNNTSSLYEVPAQQWADLTHTDGGYGISILNDCKYGWDKPNDNTLRLTLIHTPVATYGNNKQDTQDFGENRFTYSIYGHRGNWVNGRTVTQGERLNQPLRAFQTEAHSGNMGKALSFLTISNPNITVKAVKLAENTSEYMVRVQETSGSAATNVALSMGNGIAGAREVNGFEDAIGPAAVDSGKLIFDIGAYKPKTFAITLAGSGTVVSAPLCQSLVLPYNKDVITYNSNKNDGALDSLKNSLPAELLPDEITSGGIQFQMGPKADGQNNAVACSGQTISTGGFKHVYLLAASTAGDLSDTFLVNGQPVSVKIADYKQYVGQWDLYANGIDGYLKHDAVAWVATHTHNPDVKTPSSPISAPGNSAYDFKYLFKYRLDAPAGIDTVTLPNNSNILVFAMTASDNANDDTVPAGALYDEKIAPPTYSLTVVNGTGTGMYREGLAVSISATESVGYMFKKWNGPVADPYDANTTVKMGTEPITVTAELIDLGPDLALGKTATASAYVNANEAPSKAVDGVTNTKWCDNTKYPNQWLQVDLGGTYTINRWRVRHAGAGGESTGWNTRDFKLQKSDNGSTWTDVDAVTFNTANVTNRLVNPFSARYVRLYVTVPTNNTDRAARIYELELYADHLGQLQTLTVNHGTGSGSYPEGGVIPVTASIPSGYIFKKWEGPVEDPYKYNTTVTMSTEPITVTAVLYKLGQNLALNKTATASGSVNSTQSPDKAVDGLETTKWCHNTTDFPDKWLMVDLGQEYSTINKWIVKHAGFGGESASYNTRDFELQASSDGDIWTDVDAVSGNTDNITYRWLNTPFAARYVKLVCTTPTNSSDQATRICELEVYADATPVIAAIPNYTVDEGKPLSFTIHATDADLDDLLVYSASNLPTGASFDPATRKFNWIPGYSQAGIYEVRFMVSDGQVAVGKAATIVVNHADQPPVMAMIPNSTVNAGQPVSFSINASDPDPGDTLTYSTGPLPTGASFDADTKMFRWVPDTPGTYTVRFTVSDGQLSDSQTTTIIVNGSNGNQAPVMSAIPTYTVKIGKRISFTVKATDPDGDSLNYSAASLPDGAGFDIDSGKFNWTPAVAGTYSVLFTVHDGQLTDSKVATIIVQ